MEKRFLSHIQQNCFCIATKRYGEETRQEKLQALHLKAKNTIVIYYKSDYYFLVTIFTFDDQCLKLLFLSNFYNAFSCLFLLVMCNPWNFSNCLYLNRAL